MDSALGQGVEPARRPAVLDFLGQMSALHPLEPHWYLPLIGVEPSLQGRGLGSALLAQATRACDGLGLPAYLEATCPTNVALYLRHGFVPLGTIQVDDSPPLTRMRREPRGLPDRRR
jgi:GNAT superfamily N-acetyltransferase